jgi:hypothetical protein
VITSIKVDGFKTLTGFFVTSRFIDLQPDGLTTNGIVKIATDALHTAGITVDAKPEKINGDANLSITVYTIKRISRKYD